MLDSSRSACILVDNTFGPGACDCRGGFDFTLLFEEVILAIPLLSIFLLALPFRLSQLRNKDNKTTSSPLKIYKMSATTCWAALQLLLLIIWSTTGSSIRTRATIPTSVLSLAVALSGMVISLYEHNRCVRPALILDTYLFFSIIFDTARARTLWLMDQQTTVATVFSCTVGIRCVLVMLESVEKRGILLPPYSEYPKEAISGSYSRSVFFWLSSLFLNGYKNILSLHDLFPLDENLRTEKLQARMQIAWSQATDKQKGGSLLYTWIGVQKWDILTPIFWRLCLIGFTFSQPFLVTRAIELASSPASQLYTNRGYGLIGAYALVYVGIAISHGQYSHQMNRAAIMMRGSVIPCIFAKTLHLNHADAGVSTAISLINTDIQTIIPGITYMHEIWAGLVEISIAIYLLYRQVGAACAIPIAFSFGVLIVSGCIAVPIGTSQAAWIAAAQQRVASTSNTLGKMQWLRMSGLNEFAFSKIRDLRENELKVSRKLRILTMWILTLATCTPIFSPVLTFVTFSLLGLRNNDTLSISKIFTSLSIFVLFSAPLGNIIISLPNVASAITSFGRIQDYLNLEEKVDRRITNDTNSIRNESHKTSPTSVALSQALPIPDEKVGLELQQTKTKKSEHTDQQLAIFIDGKAFWPGVSTAILEIKCLSIDQAALTIILGPVGCGKSTLLKCMLGEISHNFVGEIRTSISVSEVAYCDQTPFLPNFSIRDVIMGGSGFDPEWFQIVVEACALEEDFQNWPLGESTIVGSKGISLSGGQKQRLGIARAVYSRNPFVFLDDSFSGLDSGTEIKVFNNLLGDGGLLRQGDITVVLASSDASHISSADKVVVLDEHGTITTQGTPSQISQGSGLSLGALFQKKSPIDDAKSRDGEAQAIESTAIETQNLVSLPIVETYLDSRRQKGDSTVYKFYLGSAGWKPCFIFVVAMLLIAACDSFSNIWLKWWAEANAKIPNDKLEKWLTVYAAMATGSMILLLIGTWQVFIVCIENSGVFFHDILINTTSRATINFFSTVDSGITLNRFSQDLQLIDMELPTSALGVAISLVFCVASGVLMSVASKYFSIVIPFVFIVFYFIQHFYLRTSRQMRFLDIEHKAPLYSQLIETLQGLITIRAFKWEKEAEKRNWRILDDSQRPAYLLFCLQQWLILSVNMVVAAMAIILITLTTTLRQEIGPGYMGIAMINIIAFGETSKSLIETWVGLEISIGAVARIKHFSAETELEEAGLGDPSTQINDPQIPEDWPSSGKIEFRDVTAAYSPTTPILQNIILSIAAGEKIGICGRTGSGKSSLIQTLFSMMPLTAGTITIDNIPLHTLPPSTIRTRIVGVPQEPYISATTIRLNLNPYSTHSDASIITVLQKVQLWEAAILPRGGLDAEIDDTFFSHGQAQLFSLARAILRDPKVLVLDEVTSSLDGETEQVVRRVVEEEFVGVTVVAVAHRLEFLRGFDRIVVLDKGRIVEVGRPGDLMEVEGGWWRRMVEG